MQIARRARRKAPHDLFFHGLIVTESRPRRKSVRERELRRTKEPPLCKGRWHQAYHSSKRSSGGQRNLPCARGGGTRRITVRRVTEGLKPRSCAHVSDRRRGALRFASPLRSPAGCRSSILCRWERHTQRAALSLRTSDRRHWCGNPFSPLLSRPPARTLVGIRQAFPAHGEGGPLAVDEVPAKRTRPSPSHARWWGSLKPSPRTGKGDRLRWMWSPRGGPVRPPVTHAG